MILKGATGAGKSYITNALGVAACRKLYKVRYVHLPDLLNEFAVAKALNTQNKVKAAYAKLDLLIIDEWLLRICCIIKIPKVADKNGEHCISILEKIAGQHLRSDNRTPEDPLQAFTNTIILILSDRTIRIRRKGEC